MGLYEWRASVDEVNEEPHGGKGHVQELDALLLALTAPVGSEHPLEYLCGVRMGVGWAVGGCGVRAASGGRVWREGGGRVVVSCTGTATTPDHVVAGETAARTTQCAVTGSVLEMSWRSCVALLVASLCAFKRWWWRPLAGGSRTVTPPAPPPFRNFPVAQ